ncbi:MAG TPA: acetate uptake transporter [Phycisphaerae bacterium]|jgi:succinate-acetate transporter protein|nr:acetate uptake transporter [Phycisphaerae bacterium]
MADLASPLSIKDNTANPAPLGLFAFGTTTILLNLANAGVIKLSIVILSMGIFYGGLAQVIAGCLEWKKNNTFGTTAFLSYGFFWLTLVAIFLLPSFFPNQAPDDPSLGWYLLIWGLFTLGLFIGTFRLSVALMVVFGSLTLLFFLLSAEHFAHPGEAFSHFTGYEGIFCGASACYTGLALLLNEVYGGIVLPLGLVRKA